MPRGKPRAKAKVYNEREQVAAATAVANSDLPHDAIAALEEAGEDTAQVLEACRAVGMTRGMALALIERLAVTKTAFRHEPKRVGTRDLITRIEERLDLVMHYLDELGIASASPKDLAIIFGILVEKRQLLLGEPTQILSVDERKHINSLIPELIREARSRGMTIDLNPSQYEELGDEYKTAKVIPPSVRVPGGVGSHNRRMLAKKRD